MAKLASDTVINRRRAKLTPEQRQMVADAIVAGASERAAAAIAGASQASAHAIAVQTRGLVDWPALRPRILSQVAEYLDETSRALSVQSRILGDEAWLREHSADQGSFGLAQAQRVMGDQLLRYLAAFRAFLDAERSP